MAMAAANSQFLYLPPPSKPRALHRSPLGAVHTLRKLTQGAGTAILAYTGAGSVVGTASADSGGITSFTDFTTIDGLTQGMIQGHLTGPAQLVAGALLFLAAGRSSARMVGLFGGVALMYLYSQGVNLDDIWQYGQSFLTRIGAAASAFQSPNVAP